MSNDAAVPARLLDLTRLISRAGQVLTGIDRVELAYLKALTQRKTTCFGLIRTPIGFLLLNEAGLQDLADRLEGKRPWGPPSALSRVYRKRAPMQKRALSDARRLSFARTHRGGLTRLLARHLPKGSAYLNVGHSNLTDRVIQAVKHGAKGRIAVVLHDAIPLDHPELQRPEAAGRFQRMLKKAHKHADFLIFSTHAARQRVEHHMRKWGAVPPAVVAAFGVEPVQPAAEDLPDGLPPNKPYFVSVGTIEPRKNHALLLDVWEQMAKQTPPEDMPHLVICGARGWMNEDVFARLDRSPLRGTVLHEANDLSDGAIAALLKGAKAALYPSVAEGFGFPMIEAAMMGVPVLVNDLPVYRETLGDFAVYASVSDRYLWEAKILSMASQAKLTGDHGRSDQTAAFEGPVWAAHFNEVLRLT